MKTTLIATIAVFGLAMAAPAFAADAHRDPVAAGARSSWQTNETGGAGGQQRNAESEGYYRQRPQQYAESEGLYGHQRLQQFAESNNVYDNVRSSTV